MPGVKEECVDAALLETPCYVYDMAELEGNMQAFANALSSGWGSNAIIGYSVKTAPIGALVELAYQWGYFIEVVSDDEFALALEAGVDSKRIIFNGPIKTKEWLYFAFRHGSIVNLDSQRELEWTIAFADDEGKVPKVGLRIGFDLESLIPGECTAEDGMTRFGYDYESGAFRDAVRMLREAGIEPNGIHVHLSTKSHLPRSYATVASKLVDVVRECEMNHLEYVDLGGGYYGGGSNREVYEEYVSSVSAELALFFDPKETTLIFEPGGSVLATAGEYWGRVIDAKDKRDARFLITELSSLNTNPVTLGRLRESCRVLDAAGREVAERHVIAKQYLCGYTCMELDRIACLKEYPEIEVGDIVILMNTGAYTASFMPMFFIQQPPNVYIRVGESFRPVIVHALPKPEDVL